MAASADSGTRDEGVNVSVNACGGACLRFGDQTSLIFWRLRQYSDTWCRLVFCEKAIQINIAGDIQHI